MLVCPNCGAELKISLVFAEGEGEKEAGSPKPINVSEERNITIKIHFKTYSISNRDIEEAAASLEYPDTIQKYYIELADKEGKPDNIPSSR